MQLSTIFLSLARFFLPPTVIALCYLYFYPVLTDCGFKPVKRAEAACRMPGSEKPAVPVEIAPFRLLALADPQLEGDTSLPDPNAPFFPSLQRLQEDISRTGVSALGESWLAVRLAVTTDLPKVFQGCRKRLDLLGNDYYLAHIYRSVKWWTKPTHTVVLGDLLGSQWIDDAEFDERARRFWDRVFHGAQHVPIDITTSSAKIEVLGEDTRWDDRIIAVAGNHDIGYAGDIDSNRLARFEREFGHVNWEMRFILDDGIDQSKVPAMFHKPKPELRLVVLNSMNLDEPAKDHQLRDETLMFLGRSFTEKQSRNNGKEGTIVLTHVPLYKEAGVCVDPPMINYFPNQYGGGIREQNHLRRETSQQLLHGLASQALILNGHDHEGCDTYHFQNGSALLGDTSWYTKPFGAAKKERSKSSINGIREITVRSMMGSFSGNAGLLSAWFDNDKEEWHFEYSTCVVGVQHIWWAVHVLALIESMLVIVGLVCLATEAYDSHVFTKQKTE